MSDFNPNLHSSIGALEIGVVISTLLFGMLTLQVYMYYSNFSSDTLSSKMQVAFVWFCELASAICVTHAIYLISVTHYGDKEFMIKTPLTIAIGIIFASFIPPIVHTHFALRVYKLSNKPFIPVLSIILSFLSWVGLVIAGWNATKMVTLAQYVDQWSWILTTNAVLRIINDVLTTVTLVAYLCWRKGAGYSSTLPMMDKMIEWSIETGFITGVAGVAMIICFLTMKNNEIWIGILMVISRLYANSYMAALNSRLTLRAMKPDIVYINNQARISHRPPPQINVPAGIQIEFTKTVLTEVEVCEDTAVRSPNHTNDQTVRELLESV